MPDFTLDHRGQQKFVGNRCANSSAKRVRAGIERRESVSRSGLGENPEAGGSPKADEGAVFGPPIVRTPRKRATGKRTEECVTGLAVDAIAGGCLADQAWPDAQNQSAQQLCFLTTTFVK